MIVKKERCKVGFIVLLCVCTHKKADKDDDNVDDVLTNICSYDNGNNHHDKNNLISGGRRGGGVVLRGVERKKVRIIITISIVIIKTQ